MMIALVVEDDLLVGDDLAEIIHMSIDNCVVLRATDAGDALHALEQAPGAVSLVILHLGKDDPRAAPLWDRLIDDGARVILVDGKEPRVPDTATPSSVRVIDQPFTSADVDAALRYFRLGA